MTPDSTDFPVIILWLNESLWRADLSAVEHHYFTPEN
jgi:hypothetical protein